MINGHQCSKVQYEYLSISDTMKEDFVCFESIFSILLKKDFTAILHKFWKDYTTRDKRIGQEWMTEVCVLGELAQP